MKRYCLAAILPPDETDDAYRTVIDDLAKSNPIRSVQVMPGDPETGTWALVLVAGRNLGFLNGQPGVDLLPDFPKDGRLNAMHGPTKMGMERALSRRGITVDTTSSRGYREVLRDVGRKHNPQFDEDAFDVLDVV